MSVIDRLRAATGKEPLPKPRLSQDEIVEHIRSRFYEETDRVLSLPCVTYESADMNEFLRRPGGTMTLEDVQSQMLCAARHANGLIAFAGTGSGKTFVACLLGSAMENVTRTLVFAPASTLINLNRECARLQPHFHVPRGLHFYSYEALQRATKEGQQDFIEEKILEHGGDPHTTLLVFDEAHALQNLQSARGARVMRCVLKYPMLRCCMLSGSMTDKSLKEYAHIAWMALREGSPIPSPWGQESDQFGLAADCLQSFAAVLDKDGQPTAKDWDQVQRLWNWAYPGRGNMLSYVGAERVLYARKAFNLRLRMTPGVVLTRNTSLANVALVINGINLELPEEVAEAIELVDREGLDPAGNIVPDQSSIWRIKRQLAQGFYYVWDWPVDIMTGKPVRDDAWLLARSTWNSLVRKEIKFNGDTGYDSALLVYQAVRKQIRDSYASTPIQFAWLDFISRSCKDDAPGQVSSREQDALEAWQEAGGSAEAFDACEAYFFGCSKRSYNEIELSWLEWSSRQKHKPRPPTKTVWLSSFFFDYISGWAQEQIAAGTPPILWYDSEAAGEELGRRGFPVYGAGTNPNPANIMEPSFAFPAALSLKTHSEGKNLQPWSQQLMLVPPVSGRRWEQCLARCHRQGQQATPVRMAVMQHIPEFRDALGGARAAAEYVESNLENPQKLLHAIYQDIKTPKTGSEKFAVEWADKEDDEDE